MLAEAHMLIPAGAHLDALGAVCKAQRVPRLLALAACWRHIADDGHLGTVACQRGLQAQAASLQDSCNSGSVNLTMHILYWPTHLDI